MTTFFKQVLARLIFCFILITGFQQQNNYREKIEKLLEKISEYPAPDLRYKYLTEADTLIQNYGSQALSPAESDSFRIELCSYWLVYCDEISGDLDFGQQKLNQYTDLIRKQRTFDTAAVLMTHYVAAKFYHNKLADNQAISTLNSQMDLLTRLGAQETTPFLCYIMLGNIYKAQKAMPKALYYYKRAEAIEQKGGRYFQNNRLIFYLAFADYYIANKEAANATAYLNKARMSKIGADYQGLLTKIESHLSKLLRNSASEKAFLDQSLAYNIRNYGQQNRVTAETYLSLADYEKRQKNPTKALNYCQKALESVSLEPVDKAFSLANNPSVKNGGITSFAVLIDAINVKTKLLLSEALKSPQYLPIAFETAQLGVRVLDSIRLGCDLETDKLHLSDNWFSIYENALSAAYQLYKKDRKDRYLSCAFEACEKSKALVLLQAVRNGSAEQTLSSGERNDLYLIRQRLKSLQKNIYDSTVQKQGLHPVWSLQEQGQLEEKLKNGIAKLATQHDNYAKRLAGNQPVTLKMVQNDLIKDDSTALIDYFVGEQAVFTFLIRKDTICLFDTLYQPDKITDIAYLRSNNTQPDSFRIKAHRLYNYLLEAPLSISARTPVTRLIIIPDGALNYLPFSMLVTTPTPQDRYAQFDFLINKYITAYAYSASVLKYQNEIKREIKAPNTFLAFAPTYSLGQSTPLKPFEKTIEAAQYLADLLGGRALYKQKEAEDEATKKRFMDEANQYRILHFFMHTIQDSSNAQYTKLAFAQTRAGRDTGQNYLYVNELYNLRLNAELAVLGACSTGFGNFNRGEGVTSLSQAFTSAGVSATVTSLWDAAETQSVEIITAFYENLQAGKSKDEALALAQRKYLADCKNNDKAWLGHPNLWAVWIMVGDTKPMQLPTSKKIPPLSMWLISGSFLLGLTYFYKKYLSNKK